MGQGWVGIDLDGTLALYTGWKGIDKIGEPILPMLELVKGLLAQGIHIKILTARVSSKVPEDQRIKAREAITAWTLEHLGKKLPITAEKDFAMIECYDDRAITVEYNTGQIMTKNRDLI